MSSAAEPWVALDNALVDPSFISALPERPLFSDRTFVRFPDGTVAALFGPTKIPDSSNYDDSTVALIKTLKDGSIDPRFVPALDLTTIDFNSPSSLILWMTDEGRLGLSYDSKDGNHHSVAFDDDGALLPVAPLTATPNTSGADSPGHYALENGNDLEVAFVSFSGTLTITYTVTTPGGETVSTSTQVIDHLTNSYNTFSVSFLADALGRVLVIFDRLDGGFFGDGSSLITRVLADGSWDASFEPKSILGSFWLTRDPHSDKFRLVQTWTRGIHVPTTTTSYDRLLISLEHDPTFHSWSYESMVQPRKTDEYLPTGESIFDGFLHVQYQVGYEGSPGYFSVTKYDSNAQLDENYRVQQILIDQYQADNPDSALQVRFLPDGRLLVTGSFFTINGVKSPHIAYLYPAVHDAGTRLSNLSLRAATSADEGNLILGFALTGSGSLTGLARAAGPALSVFDVSHLASDPFATLYSEATPLFTNDDWGGGDTLVQLTRQTGAFPFLPESKDAALSAALPEGRYSIVISPGKGESGVVLGEFYDASSAPANFDTVRVANLSARALVGTGDQTLIAGFTLEGPNAKRVLIRAIGPGLAPFGLSSTASDPAIAVYRGAQKLAENDNWSGDTKDVDLFATLGAFALANGSKDAALVITLAPGSHTVHVTNKDGTPGLALLEVYEIL